MIAALVLAAWLLVELSPGAGAAATHAQRLAGSHHPLIPSVPGVRLPIAAATVSSLNWSGYADVAPAGSHITAVTGNWTVPTAQLVPPGLSASWTGMAAVLRLVRDPPGVGDADRRLCR